MSYNCEWFELFYEIQASSMCILNGESIFINIAYTYIFLSYATF